MPGPLSDPTFPCPRHAMFPYTELFTIGAIPSCFTRESRRNYALVYKFSMNLQLCLAYTGGLVGVGNKDRRMDEE